MTLVIFSFALPAKRIHNNKQAADALLHGEWSQAGCVLCMSAGDEDQYESNNFLRLGIFEAVSGILNGLSREQCDKYLASTAIGLVDFVETVFNDNENQASLLPCCLLPLLPAKSSSSHLHACLQHLQQQVYKLHAPCHSERTGACGISSSQIHIAKTCH